MTSQSFYHILPELAVEIALEKNHEALLIIEKYCKECEWIQVRLDSAGQLTLKTDEVVTAIYCGLDPIAVVICTGLAMIGRCWWATSLFRDALDRTNKAWDSWRKRLPKSLQMKLF